MHTRFWEESRKRQQGISISFKDGQANPRVGSVRTVPHGVQADVGENRNLLMGRAAQGV